MSRGRRFLVVLAKIVGVLVALLVVAHVVVGIVGRQVLARELERVRASGAPTNWEQVIPPPVPDDQNAALLYDEAFAALDFTAGVRRPRYPPYPPAHIEAAPRSALSDYLQAENREQRKVLEKGIQNLLADNAQALSYAQQAAERPGLRFDRNWRPPVRMTFPQYHQLIDLSKLAWARALLRADGGDVSGALEAWSLSLAIVSQLESDPTPVGQLTRFALLSIASGSLRQVLQDGRPSPEQCRALAQPLARIPLKQPFINSLEAERTISLWSLDFVRKNPQALAQGDGTALPFLTLLCSRVVAPFDDAALLRLWDRQIALARKPTRETVGQWQTLFDPDIPGYALLTRTLFPVFARATLARDETIAHVSLMSTALGLTAYRTQYGAYPESLDALQRALQWRRREDPFSGRDLVYRRQGIGYLLYSVGQDLHDDGGIPERRVQAPGQRGLGLRFDGDIVWRQER